MNRDDLARKQRRAHDGIAADLLRATAHGQDLEDMPPELAMWIRRDIALRLDDVLSGRAGRNEELEAEAVRLKIIPPPPGHAGSIVLVN